MVLKIGEIVHIVEHRRFESDMRRHFIGKVNACENGLARIKGQIFKYSLQSGQFEKIEDARERFFRLDNMISLTVLPPGCNAEQLAYERVYDNLYLTDGGDVHMEIGVFGAHG